MIQIEAVSFIPLLPYTEEALGNITEEAWKSLKSSQDIYVVKDGDVPLFCLGILKSTLISKPYIWIIPCKALSSKYLRELKRVFETLAPENLWAIFLPSPKTIAFAKFFGFHTTRQIGDFLIMER